MIPITKPFIPPLKEYNGLLEGIWQRNWLTNNGPLVNDLELKLKKYFDQQHLLLVSNGTIAIQTHSNNVLAHFKTLSYLTMMKGYRVLINNSIIHSSA